MPEEKISIGVSFAPIVDSVKTAKINEIIQLGLITGLNNYDLEWINGDIVVKTNPDRTVVFTVPGVYQAKVLGQYILHESYWITVIE